MLVVGQKRVNREEALAGRVRGWIVHVCAVLFDVRSCKELGCR